MNITYLRTQLNKGFKLEIDLDKELFHLLINEVTHQYLKEGAINNE